MSFINRRHEICILHSCLHAVCEGAAASSLHRRGGDTGRVRWRAVSDAAFVRAAREQDIALHAPGRTPAVLDLPVLRAGLGAHAYGEDAVVELLATGFTLDDALLVGLEDGLVGLDRDRKRADGEGSRHGCLALHVLVAATWPRACAWSWCTCLSRRSPTCTGSPS